MIFPAVRISELKNKVHLKRQQLDQSAASFKSTLIDFTNPLSLLKKHPFWALGAIGTTLTALASSVKLVKKSGTLRKVAAIGGSLFLRNILPPLTSAILSALGSTRKKKRE